MTDVVKTRHAERRELLFRSMDDILAEGERLAAGPVETTGNWTAPQVIQHVARLIDASVRGFDARIPLPMRVVGRLMKGSMLRSPMRAGFTMPTPLTQIVPDDDATMQGAIEELRDAIGRAERERMTIPSPLLGPLSHEDWVRLHCRHAELHFGFIRPVG